MEFWFGVEVPLGAGAGCSSDVYKPAFVKSLLSVSFPHKKTQFDKTFRLEYSFGSVANTILIKVSDFGRRPPLAY